MAPALASYLLLASASASVANAETCGDGGTSCSVTAKLGREHTLLQLARANADLRRLSVPGNHYEKTEGIGGWGGWCTCPDGQRYNVGDRHDGCAGGPSSLACIGGTPGECNREFNASREGMQVTCKAPASDSPNIYEKAQSGVGGWGGWCTCPNGQRYNVGDLNDGCARGAVSLACIGGAAGECHREFNASREGMRVVCAGASNDYRKAEKGVGGWGGWCTCPDGQRYNVGDTNDGCAHGRSSLACFGGVPGECVREMNTSRDGMQVTCAGPVPAEPTPAPSPTCTQMGPMIADTDLAGELLEQKLGVASSEGCCSFCEASVACQGFAYAAADQACYLKRSFLGTFHKAGIVTQLKASSDEGCIGFGAPQIGKDLAGELIDDWAAPNLEGCCASCGQKPECQGFAFRDGRCYLKANVQSLYDQEGVISRVKDDTRPLHLK